MLWRLQSTSSKPYMRSLALILAFVLVCTEF